MSQPVGVVGLGNIGGALAANLVADGDVVTVFDLDAARADALAAVDAGLGARDFTDLVELAEHQAGTRLVLDD